MASHSPEPCVADTELQQKILRRNMETYGNTWKKPWKKQIPELQTKTHTLRITIWLAMKFIWIPLKQSWHVWHRAYHAVILCDVRSLHTCTTRAMISFRSQGPSRFLDWPSTVAGPIHHLYTTYTCNTRPISAPTKLQALCLSKLWIRCTLDSPYSISSRSSTSSLGSLVFTTCRVTKSGDWQYRVLPNFPLPRWHWCMPESDLRPIWD